MENKWKEIVNYFDSNNRVMLWPSRQHKKKQQLVLEYLAEKVEKGKRYSEKEISALINRHHGFNDAALLRREMVSKKLLQRTKDCRAYWLTEH